MKTSFAPFRLLVALLFLLGLMVPFTATAATAQGTVTCDDFTTEREAQDALDDDPDLADSLDEDGNGIACDEPATDVRPEDIQLPEETEEATEESTEDATEEATEEATDEATATSEDEPETSAADAEEYLTTVREEVDGLAESIETFSELVGSVRGAPADDRADIVDEFNAIADDWADYPDVAAEITAPDGLEEIDEAYQDLAAEVGEMGENWQVFWAAEQDSPEEAEAEEGFNDNLETVETQIEDLTTLLDETAESATDDATPAAVDEEGTEYVATVEAELDGLSESIAEFTDLVAVIEDETASTSEQRDAVEESVTIAEEWSEYPVVADGITAPDGFEDIDDAYQSLAADVGEMGDAWITFTEADEGSTEADEAEATFSETLESVETQIEDLTTLLEDAASGGTDEPTETPEVEVDAEAEEYLTAVRDNTDELAESLDRLNELLSQGEDLTNDEVAEVLDIVDLWADASEVAADLDAPAEFADIQTAYEELADELGEAAENFDALGEAEADSPEEADAIDALIENLENAETLLSELDELLTDAGF